MENNITTTNKDLATDTDYSNQPEGTYPFALNTVEKNLQYRGNEESNEMCYSIPDEYTIIGNVYIGDGETMLFLTNGMNSEIAVVNKTNIYKTIVNTPDLNFRHTHQIDAVYRLRKGCEKTVYFTDNLNKVEL